MEELPYTIYSYITFFISLFLMYQQELLDHYHHSPHRGTLDNPDFSSEVYSPSCGDIIAFCGIMHNNRPTEIKFTGSGCVISQAAASLLAAKALQSTYEDILAFGAQDMLTLLGIQLGPTRLKCALLPLEALQQALRIYTSKQQE
ncbi:MAG: iron-sulfur cluster assembly scaffold protein [Candidatus Dependentiae bacterium]|nr:iron-sulfur cluster assembly scaffold protein [Candidatus Dependentiae bacterium]